MDTTEFIWQNGKFINWEDAKIHVLTHALHYGGGAFEGIRVYNTDAGPAIFRLDDHVDRFYYSASALKMEISFTKEEIKSAIIETVRKNKLTEGYIRPIVFYGYGKMGLNPEGASIEVVIACWPWGNYLPEKIDVKITDYIRIHPKSSITDAKITGHYVNSILSVQQLKGTKYQEALLLDYDGNIAEGPGENFYIVKDGIVITPPLGTILKGITRRTVFEICEKQGIKIVEKMIRPEEAFKADESFFSGTAAKITPIVSIDDNVIGSGEVGPVSSKIRDIYRDIVTGKNKDFENYLTIVN